MKSITKLITLSFALLLSLNLATAQRGQGKGKMHKIENAEAHAEKQTQRLTEKLSLTSDQAAKVAAINLEYAKKLQAAKAANTDKEAGRETFKALRTEKHTAIKAVLTPEQVTKMEERRGGKGKHGKKGRKGENWKGGEGKAQTSEGRAAKSTQRLTEKLSLNADQVAKVTAINLEYAEFRKAAKANATDRETGKATMKELRTKQQNAIKAILNTEQLATYESMKKEWKGKRGGRKGKGKKEQKG